ncbi:glycosyltransferase family 4 protein [Chitinolyticbacter meiyuanensis]|uniref:glycosyltransferase family 4 protein n=1 Tax=Chitinolyticbacter meiyuanensis TaxID=682798 RepID=UPI001C9E3D28|nr:glycosyltransferase family 4 protein [Chitinolyticbacter meiyuanensis]
MIRLAIVRQKYNPHGGAERFVTRALQALSQRRALDVTLLCREWKDGGSWHCQQLRPFHLGRAWRERAFARAAQREFGRFDLVQSHERVPGCDVFRAGDGVHAVWLEQYARTQSGWANLLRRFSPFHRYVLAAERAMLSHPRLRMVICNSELVRAQIAERFAVPDDKLCVIYNGVDTEAFHPQLSDKYRYIQRQAWGVPQDAPLLVHVGSGFERKGVATTLRALAQVEGVYLVVAGHDKAARRYRRLADTLGVAHRVRFLGAVNDVKPVYGAGDALVLPTLYDPFPNVCVEALAAGLPVFTSTQCGAAEWLREGENGWVRDALDVDGLAAAIADWQRHQADWPRLRAAARATAEPHTLARMGQALEDLYARLLTPQGTE